MLKKILSPAILIISFTINSMAYADKANEREALNASALAFYKQAGLELAINQIINDKIPKKMQGEITLVYRIYQVVITQYLTITIPWP